MAEPQATLLKLQRSSFGKKGGPVLTRGQLVDARDVLRQAVVDQPENTRLPWWLERVENRLHHLETGVKRPDPPMPPMSEKERKANRTATWVVLGLFVLVLGGCGLLIANSDGGPGGSDADEIGASVICEQFVEDRLRSPGSAEFASYSDQVVTGGPTQFVVQSYVDSENGFGALLRTAYTCTVSSTDGDQWTLVDLTTSED